MRRRVLVTGSGQLTLSDVIAFLDQRAQEPSWSWSTIEDLRALTWVPTTDEIHTFLAHIEALAKSHGRRGPVAFVIDNNAVLFGMFRMYSILADVERVAVTMEVFHTMAEANEWLTTQESP